MKMHAYLTNAKARYWKSASNRFGFHNGHWGRGRAEAVLIMLDRALTYPQSHYRSPWSLDS